MPIIQAVDRALAILDLFDENDRELKITEISARVGLHKSTVHSLLKTLQKHRYIEQDEQGLYRLGMRLLEKGQLLLQGFDLRGIAAGPLRQLSGETGQTVHLVIRDGAEGVYIDKVEGSKAAIRYSRIGRRVPLHSSAVGKVLAAFIPASEAEPLLKGYAYSIHTPRTIAGEEAFRQELKNVRETGVAFDREENEPGVRCAAAPVYDHAGHLAAAISISTMAATVGDTQLAEYADMLGATAARISQGLGYRPR
ncbi:IclR family transcriptional regulator [Paenibacillus glycinis]|uniref:Helix-turn-helix domain-containing protein n=1 Tax=Paenibacillus glycinis TaxID=2697035 RepID=A0ABW9XXW0_9BACL|nr:IclR family transcriptional regulator [Paenibacillus glycinis]NBD27351.1 helix-turn-helix domain-containing protein [Paenibacillus glycinis]